MSAVLALSCPRCAGALDPEAGPGLLARCESCGVLARIEDESGLSRLAVMPAIDRDFAWQVTTEEARRKDGGADLRFVSSKMLFVPYWRIDSLIVGRVEGRRPRTRNVIERDFMPDGSSTVRTRQITDGFDDVEREIQKHLVFAIAACPLEELGLATLDRQRQDAQGLGIKQPLDRIGNLVHYSTRLREYGTVLDPLIQKQQALSHAEDLLSSYTSGLTRGLVDARIDTAVIDRHFEVIYYPVISLTFHVARRPARAVVDAVTGKVVSITLPEAVREWNDRRFVTLVALGAGWISGSLAHLAAFPPKILEGSEDGRSFLFAAAAGAIFASIAGLATLVSQVKKRIPS